MYVGLHEASFYAVGLACGAELGKNGYRFGFWSTTPISAKRRHAAAQNGLGRGLARHQRSGQPQKVLGARRGELQLEQRPSNASRRAGASRRFSPFSLFSPWPLFCLARPFRGSPRENPTLHFAGTPPRQSQHPRGPTVRVWAKCNEGWGSTPSCHAAEVAKWCLWC